MKRPKSSPKDERYTLADTLDDALKFGMELLGEEFEHFDLDLAACEQSAHAPSFFTKEDDALRKDRVWFGRCFLNPPYTQIPLWVDEVNNRMRIEENPPRLVMTVLPGNRQEQPWWQKHIEPYRDGNSKTDNVTVHTRNLENRRRYGKPGDKRGKKMNHPETGTVLVAWVHHPRAAKRTAKGKRRGAK